MEVAVEATVVEEPRGEETAAGTEGGREMDKKASDQKDSEAKEVKKAEETSGGATKTAVGAMVGQEVKAVAARIPPPTEVALHRGVDPWTARNSTTPNWRGS